MEGSGDLFYLNGRYDFLVLFSSLCLLFFVCIFFFPIKSWQIITAVFSFFLFLLFLYFSLRNFQRCCKRVVSAV